MGEEQELKLTFVFEGKHDVISGQTQLSGLICPGFMVLNITDVTPGALCTSSSLTCWICVRCLSAVFFSGLRRKDGIKSPLQQPVNVCGCLTACR